jgi:ribosomal protein S18 acetylase RimI-like enzyme
MVTNLRIRNATPQDVNQAVILLHCAMGSLGEFIFGNGVTSKALSVLSKLFIAENNRFNYRHVYLAEGEHRIAGLLLAFRSQILHRLDLLTGLRLMGILPFAELLQLVGRVSRQVPVRESGKGEFYISDLAVAPEFRRRNIGTQLLAFAEKQAEKMGLRRCSLIVTHGNQAAKRLYLRNGYKIVHYFNSTRPRQFPWEAGYYRMVKDLSL